MMELTLTNGSLLFLTAVLNLAMIRIAILKREVSKRSSRRVLAYASASLLVCCTIFTTFIQPRWVGQIGWKTLPIVAVFLSVLLFVFLERSALYIHTSPWITIAASSNLFLFSILLYPGLFAVSPKLTQFVADDLAAILPGAILYAGWVILLGQSAWDILQANQNPTNPTIRNKAQLWLGAWAALVGGNLLLLNQVPVWGLLLTSLAGGIAAVIALTRNLPYPRYLAREAVSYLVLFVPVFTMAWAGYELIRRVELILPGFATLGTAASVSLLFIATYRLLVQQKPRLIGRLIPTTRYDTAQLLREYSQSITDTTAPNVLATISISLLSKAIGLQYGHLFEVVPDARPDQNLYRIQDAGGIGANSFSALTIQADSIFTSYFRNSRHSLFVNQVHTNVLLDKALPEDKAWFSNPQIEVFVPINTKNDWVGLFALGQKTSGEAYTQDDLTLVNALADQISLALQNARLIDSLMRVNNDFRRAYTAMDQSNRQLQQALTHLEKIDRTKSDFISVSSHELRTPMTLIRGYSEMLLDDDVIQSNPYHHKLLKGIQTGMDRMVEVVESMVDVASIDSRTLKLHKESTSLSFVVRNVIEGLEKALEERRINLTVENLREIPNIEADRESLQKVFMQLLTNAIKFTPDGGSITVSAIMLPEDAKGFKGGGVEAVIRDTGIGIAHENLELVFKKFYQTGPVALHSSGKTKFKGAGSGLGLAIAKGIVEAHGGKIWAESAGYDEATCPGSQFHVALPM